MYGDEALKLVREAKRARAGLLPVYNETAVRNVLKEARILAEEQDRIMAMLQAAEAAADDDWLASQQAAAGGADETLAAASDGHQAAFLIHHASLDRNKRCLLAYHMARLDKIKAIQWDLMDGTVDDDTRRRMAPAEATFADRYSQLLISYKGMYDDLDLTAVAHPPKDLYVCVRVVKDCGEIITENGRSVVLKKNSQHFLLRTDVERLITQGFLQHVE
ncbi:DNA replication protein psf1 [Blastocladiella emersonii ATCC 22665]|nr:DNA replication protein psf1 [Blastocladiella emersonii ATCC 22665]